MNYTIFEPVTGEIMSTMSASSYDDVEVHLLDKAFIDGYFHGDEYYIDVETRSAVQKSADPSTDFVKYIWDYSIKSWAINAELTAQSVREHRNALLGVVDKVNPVWFMTLTDEQRTQAQQYRQALLDVPQQTGFPLSIEWPTKPTWL
jgi:hypothetical protein